MSFLKYLTDIIAPHAEALVAKAKAEGQTIEHTVAEDIAKVFAHKEGGVTPAEAATIESVTGTPAADILAKQTELTTASTAAAEAEPAAAPVAAAEATPAIVGGSNA